MGTAHGRKPRLSFRPPLKPEPRLSIWNLRLPKRWENSLNEIIKIAKKIRRKVRQANSIRISTKGDMTTDELVKAVNKRIELNQKAKILFSAYDAEFATLMRKINLKSYEAKRLKELLSIIIAELNREPGVKIELTARMGLNDIQYETMNGIHVEKLMLTSSNVDNWLEIRNKSEKAISEKLTKDYNFLHSLKKKKDENSLK